MNVHERWPDRTRLRASYEHHTVVLKQLVSEYCDDSVTIAFQFLNAQKLDSSVFVPQHTASAIPYDNRSLVWVAANQEQLYKDYPDEFILVEGESVTAHSADVLKLEAVAQQRGITTAFMTRVVRPTKSERTIYVG